MKTDFLCSIHSVLDYGLRLFLAMFALVLTVGCGGMYFLLLQCETEALVKWGGAAVLAIVSIGLLWLAIKLVRQKSIMRDGLK